MTPPPPPNMSKAIQDATELRQLRRKATESQDNLIKKRGEYTVRKEARMKELEEYTKGVKRME